MPKEINYLVDLLKNKKETQKIIVFKNDDIFGVWVIVNNASASVDVVMEYCSLFQLSLDKFPLFFCDFEVYEEDEIANNLPNHIEKIFVCTK